MPQDPERQRAREAVAAYHDASLTELLTHVANAVDLRSPGDVTGSGTRMVQQALHGWLCALIGLTGYCCHRYLLRARVVCSVSALGGTMLVAF